MERSSPQGLGIDKCLLSVADCQSCRRCCVFREDEIEDSPVFTCAQRLKALQTFPERHLQFEQSGDLWRVVLARIQYDAQVRYVCPLYNPTSAMCEVNDYEIFDCKTWPYYIMRRNGKLVVALSSTCPVIALKDRESVTLFARNVIGPLMLKMALNYPDLVANYRSNVAVLYELE